MSNDKVRELSKWMSIVANKYNRSIMTVITEFKRATEDIEDIELAKIKVLTVLSHGGAIK